MQAFFKKVGSKTRLSWFSVSHCIFHENALFCWQECLVLLSLYDTSTLANNLHSRFVQSFDTPHVT